MQSRLEQETITVTQSPIERYPFAVASPSPTPPQERDPHSKQVGIQPFITIGGAKTTAKDVSSPVKKSGERTTSFAIGFQQPSTPESAVKCFFFVDNEGEILMGLENDIIGAKILLASPHLGNLRARVESVMKTLMQLKELMGLLSHCQDQVVKIVLDPQLHACTCVFIYVRIQCYVIFAPQWKQLLSLFSSIDPKQLQAYGQSDLQQATIKFQEVVKSIQDDPRLLSLLGKRRGQKGFRELQGDSLRQCFDKIQTSMVCFDPIHHTSQLHCTLLCYYC